MNKNSPLYEIPQDGLNTPGGKLYPLQKLSVQIITLIAFFLGAIFLGWIIGRIPGDLSETAQTILFVPHLLVFFLGYSICISLLSLIALDSFKWPLAKLIFKFFLTKEKPKSIEEALPSKEKMLEILVRAQKATKYFYRISWPIAIVSGFVSLLLNTSFSSILLFIIVLVSCVGYGYVLSYYGRRGYLPFPEES